MFSLRSNKYRDRKAEMGRPAKDLKDLRKHPVTCRLTDEEKAKVDQLRGAITRGEWLRRTALGRPPRMVPELNRQAWLELARLAGNLNQLAQAVNQGRKDLPQVDFEALRALTQQLRLELIGTHTPPPQRGGDKGLGQ